MRLSAGSVANLTPAEPGWTVELDWSGREADRVTCPIVAWAVVVTSKERADGLPYTWPEPVFVYDGSVYTESEYREIHDASVVVEIMPPRVEWVTP